MESFTYKPDSGYRTPVADSGSDVKVLCFVVQSACNGCCFVKTKTECKNIEIERTFVI